MISTKILCVSEADALAAELKIKISPSKIVIVRNSVAPRKKKGSCINKGVLKLLFVARLAPPKRIDLLVNCFANDERVSVTVVGDGPLMPTSRKPNNFTFLGEVMSFNDFSSYDAFILLSDSEGLPMSALEAGSAGLPLILSNVGGCSECIKWNNGFLVENTADSIKLNFNELVRNFETISFNSMQSSVLFSNDNELLDYSNAYGLNV